jgi:hypothetical protein
MLRFDSKAHPRAWFFVSVAITKNGEGAFHPRIELLEIHLPTNQE